MLVISKNAEKKLEQEIRRYAKESPRMKCFYIQFSKTDLDKGDVFETFIRKLNEVPNAYMAQVYICNDMDIFILMQGFMQRQFTALVDDLAKTLGTSQLAELANSFEIGHHGKVLRNICREKIEAIDKADQARQEAIRKARAEKATMDILAQLDAGLIEKLPERRKSHDRASILIIDDDQLSRTLAGNVIRKDYDVTYAQNGKEGLNEFITTAPDVVFLDIGLPDIDGHRVLECMLQIDPDAFVIMFSGRKDKANIMHALDIGAQGFVGKPFTRDKLFEYIGKSPYVREIQDKHKHAFTNMAEQGR